MLRGNMTSPGSASYAPPRGESRRGLNLPGLVGLTFFCVAGGAYGLEDGVGAAGPLVVLLGIVILPWLWSLPTALMTAELSTAMPEDGGYVVWVEKAFGRFWGFQEGWLSWLCSFADNALYPVMFVDYLAYLRGDMEPLERWLIAAALISIITWLNIRGTRLVGLSSIVFTALVLAPFAVMLVVGLPQVSPANWLQRTATTDWPLLISILLWNTSGWDNAGCCAGAVDAPNRVYPRAMMLTVNLGHRSLLAPTGCGHGSRLRLAAVEGRLSAQDRRADRRLMAGYLAHRRGVDQRSGHVQRPALHLGARPLRHGAANHVATRVGGNSSATTTRHGAQFSSTAPALPC